ncbi:hypothetical protein EAI_06555 [Harpegnathos saltator]|uniref:Uncharacterized protein n=1 Tax=Harpegnathos saltator TaxID=610380 RepID=E2BXI7_HARSA|nr:hypothetical protein EAI_06555 [Harpegnathos saltator]
MLIVVVVVVVVVMVEVVIMAMMVVVMVVEMMVVTVVVAFDHVAERFPNGRSERFSDTAKSNTRHLAAEDDTTAISAGRIRCSRANPVCEREHCLQREAKVVGYRGSPGELFTENDAVVVQRTFESFNLHLSVIETELQSGESPMELCEFPLGGAEASGVE